jgi:hypothetical protein
MNGTPEIRQNETADHGDGELDPREAALIVEQTAMQARRQFETASPVAAVMGAAVFLFGYGALWWSMRNQHVYKGRAGWSVAVLYGLIAVSAVVGVRFVRHATAGVSGRARRQMQAQGIAVAVAGIGAWTVQGALNLGVSFKVVYGTTGRRCR